MVTRARELDETAGLLIAIKDIEDNKKISKTYSPCGMKKNTYAERWREWSDERGEMLWWGACRGISTLSHPKHTTVNHIHIHFRDSTPSQSTHIYPKCTHSVTWNMLIFIRRDTNTLRAFKDFFFDSSFYAHFKVKQCLMAFLNLSGHRLIKRWNEYMYSSYKYEKLLSFLSSIT